MLNNQKRLYHLEGEEIMTKNKKSFPMLWLLLCVLLFSSCSFIPDALVERTANPTEAKVPTKKTSDIQNPTLTSTSIIQQIQTKQIATATATGAAINPSKSRIPSPELNFYTDPSSFSPGQYLLYWSYSETFCGLKAVSTTKKVMDVINFGCNPISDLNQNAVLSANGLFLLFPHTSYLYVLDMMDQQIEMLAPSQRDDCKVTSVSWDGERFAGICGSAATSFHLAVRTIETDWTIIAPFVPAEENDVSYATAWSASDEKLAFVKSTSETQGIYVINDIDQCLKDPGHCANQLTGPYWKKTADYVFFSPDETTLAVTTGTKIILYDIKTKQSRNLIEYSVQGKLLHGAAWSLDGKWIGYAVDNGKKLTPIDINLISPDGGNTSFFTDQGVSQVAGWLNINP